MINAAVSIHGPACVQPMREICLQLRGQQSSFFSSFFLLTPPQIVPGIACLQDRRGKEEKKNEKE